MKHLRLWFNNPKVGLTFMLVVIVLLIGMSLSAMITHKATELYCAIAETEKDLLGRPAYITDFYKPKDAIYCRMATTYEDGSSLGFCYRLGADPLVEGRLFIYLNDSLDGEGFKFEEGMIYIMEGEEKNSYPVKWPPPEAY